MTQQPLLARQNSRDHLPPKNLNRSQVTSRSSSLTPDIHLDGPRNLPSNASSRWSTRTSQPSSQSTNQDHTEDFLQCKKNNWRKLIVNCNGAAGKRAELAHLFEPTQPNAIIFCETKLNLNIKCAEFMPLGFNCFCKDRTSSGGDGVMIAVKSNYPAEDIGIEVDCEVVWISVSMRNNRKVYLGSFSRPPDKGQEPFDELEKSLSHIDLTTRNNPNTVIILGGDFNIPHINWSTGEVLLGCTKKQPHEWILEVLADHHLTQIQYEATRHKNILDLMNCTNKPSLVKHNTVIPGISDHEIVAIDTALRPQFNKKVPKKVYVYAKAKWDSIKQDQLSTNLTNNDISTNWSLLKQHPRTSMDRHIPSKMTFRKQHLPWITPAIHKMCRKKQCSYNLAKHTQKAKNLKRLVPSSATQGMPSVVPIGTTWIPSSKKALNVRIPPSNPDARTASECQSWNVMTSCTVAAPRSHPVTSSSLPSHLTVVRQTQSSKVIIIPASVRYMSQPVGSPSSLPTSRFTMPQAQTTSRPGPWESSPTSKFNLQPVNNQWSDPGQLEECPCVPHAQEGKQTPRGELPPNLPHLYLLQITGACCVSPHHVTPGGTQHPYPPPAWLPFRNVHGHPATCNHTRHLLPVI